MILIKEEFIGGEKWRRAVKLGGSDAIVLWLALKNYCSQHPNTEGFVPDEDLDGLPGAPRAARKALQALIGCGRLLPGGERGPGLVEVAEGGWRLHDYLDHSASPEAIELQREKARLRKQDYRARTRRELAAVRRLTDDLASRGTIGDSPGDTPRDSPGDTGGTVPRDALAGTSAGEGAPARAPTRAGAHPNPLQPNPTNLRGLTSTIREPREQLEPCTEHEQFAAEHALDLDHFRRDPSLAGLSPSEASKRLAGLLMSAATEQQSIGGAA